MPMFVSMGPFFLDVILCNFLVCKIFIYARIGFVEWDMVIIENNQKIFMWLFWCRIKKDKGFINETTKVD